MRKTVRALATAAAMAVTVAVVTSATGGTAFAAVGVPQITEGASGFSVYCAQDAMWEFTQGNSASPDGSFGPLTLASVKTYQKSVGLKPDGEVGPLTGSQMWQMLNFDIQHDIYGGDFMTQWGVPMSHCYQVLPTTS